MVERARRRSEGRSHELGAPMPTRENVRWTELSNFKGTTLRSFDENIENLKKLAELIGRLGFTTKSSRVWAYERTLTDLRKLAQTNQAMTFDQALRLLGSVVEVSELTTILKAAQLAVEPSIWQTHLGTLLSGNHPDVGSKSSAAWDFQFEAYVAAVVQLSGYQVNFSEPDIIVCDELGTFGIAAKRPRNENGIKRNLEKAVKQINKSGLEGFIALDCSFAVADGQSLTTTTFESAISATKTMLHAFIQSNIANISSIRFGKSVTGIIFTLHIPVTLVDEDWKQTTQLASAYRWSIFPTVTSTDVRLSRVLSFAEQCQRGLFNCA